MSKRIPYHAQQDALDAMDGKTGFALFFDMGTGKTYTTMLDAARMFKRGDVSKMLVVSPLSVAHHWEDEIDEWFAHLTVRVVRGTPAVRKRIIGGPQMVAVINYDLVHSHLDELMAAGFDLIVADESHRLASPKARWTKALLKLAGTAKYRRALTGTPIRNWELDLYNQMKFIDPTILPWRSHFAFRKEFAIEQMFGGFTKVIGMRDVERIRTLCAPHCRYVTFDDVVKDMPPWVETVRTVPLTKEQARVYREVSRDLLAEVSSGTVTAQNAAIQTLRLSQVAGGTVRTEDGEPVILGSNQMAELLTIASAATGGVVVWCKFVDEIRWVTEQLQAGGFTASCIYGEVPAAQRRHLLKSFESGALQFLVCQVQAVSEGVNELKNADLEVRWSYDWSYVTFVQSRARMRRSGRDKSKACRSILLVAEGTTDEKVAAAVKRKENVAVSSLEDIRRLVK